MDAASRIATPEPLRVYLRRPDVAKRLRRLRTPSPIRFAIAVAVNYLTIGTTILCVYLLWSALPNAAWPTTLVTMIPVGLVALVVIAARQHALLVLMHEGAHRTVSTSRRINDLLSDLLCGAPLFVSMRSYRTDHLAHHQHLNSADDPDWRRKTDDKKQRSQWHFPATEPLVRVLAKLYGYSVTYLLNSLAANQNQNQTQNQTAIASTTEAAPEAQPKLATAALRPTDNTLNRLRLTLYGAIVVALTLTGSWLGFVLFWLAPMLLVLPLIMRVRSIAEHFALRHDHALNQSRTVRAGLLERALLAPHHIGLHIDHHLLASVPFFNLPALHQLLLECPYYANNAHLNEGYFLRRRGHYGGTPASPTLTTLAQDMYSQPSERLLAMN